MSKVMWGAEWHSENKLAGKQRYILWDSGRPLLFDTRGEARAWINEHFRYLCARDDLQREPHGWRMPQAVRVRVTVEKL